MMDPPTSTLNYTGRSGRSPRTLTTVRISKLPVNPKDLQMVNDCLTYNTNASIKLALKVLSANTVYTDAQTRDDQTELEDKLDAGIFNRRGNLLVTVRPSWANPIG
ncbi:hypothetical protein M231_02412 [Tremella mesenterica]|uniref:Uncharacterized protein n=1 Tax=Tremella mesenterica TaxID=5217 RepID=A0A4Q1BQT1_TREME|nr:hypothetical protein M231_02412 [Tremella mesenterica]